MRSIIKLVRNGGGKLDYSKEPHGVYFLIDNKSFYASVECVQRGLNPLEAQLVVLSEQENTNGGLVLAASPQAKKKLGISNVSRQRDLPRSSDLLIVPPRMNLYIEKNLQINAIFRQFATAKEVYPYSIDESILDMTHSWHLFGKTPVEVARLIQEKVRTELGLYTTVGVGQNPLQAKLALDLLAKHNKSLIGSLSYDTFRANIWPITELTEVWSIGKRTEAHLNRIGIFSMSDLAHCNPYLLKKEFGSIGAQLLALSWGIDRSDLKYPVKTKEKGFSNSQVLPRDYHKQTEIEVVIQEIGEQVTARMRHQEKQAGVVHLFVGFSYAEIADTGKTGFAHQMKIEPTDDTSTLNKYLLQLFRDNWQGEIVRNIGVSLGHLTQAEGLQLSLFQPVQQQEKHYRINRVMDQLRDRFGNTAIYLGHSLEHGATMINRAGLVGGHNGGNSYQ